MLISLIVPVFNASRYLRACLDSIREQTHAEWECICVDDGSSDGSGEILDEYANNDRRFRVISLKENGGVSAARNLGLDCACGEYVGFVDSDDLIDSHWLEAVVDSVRKTNADMVKMQIRRKEQVGAAYCPGAIYNTYSDGNLFSFGILRGGLTVQNFYRRSILKDVRFPVGMKVFEDGVFNLYALLKVAMAAECKYDGYWYRDSGTSAYKRRNPSDVTRLVEELVLWFEKAGPALDAARSRALAEDRICGYVNTIVASIVAECGFLRVNGTARYLSPALQRLQCSLGMPLERVIAHGRGRLLKRFAYRRFIGCKSGCLYWMTLKVLAALKGNVK